MPDLTLRSSFIVGFPGETDAEFQELLDWVDEAQLDRVGCFKYSPVNGARANDLPDPVPAEVMDQRYAQFMERAAAVSEARLAAKVGRELKVLVDRVDGNEAIARTAGDAPEIDGVVNVKQARRLARRRIRHGEDHHGRHLRPGGRAGLSPQARKVFRDSCCSRLFKSGQVDAENVPQCRHRPQPPTLAGVARCFRAGHTMPSHHCAEYGDRPASAGLRSVP